MPTTNTDHDRQIQGEQAHDETYVMFSPTARTVNGDQSSLLILKAMSHTHMPQALGCSLRFCSTASLFYEPVLTMVMCPYSAKSTSMFLIAFENFDRGIETIL